MPRITKGYLPLASEKYKKANLITKVASFIATIAL
jgi:hypothetical protein